jgi:hypothetical protein
MNQGFTDKILLCVDCGEEFVFTVGAQEYFSQRGFSEDPKRCKTCYMDIKRKRKRFEGEPSRRGYQGKEVFVPPDDSDEDIDPSGNHGDQA